MQGHVYSFQVDRRKKRREKEERKELGDGVSAVDSEVGAGDVFAGVAEQEGDRAHEVFRGTHLTLRDQGGPLAVQLWVVIEDFAGPI